MSFLHQAAKFLPNRTVLGVVMTYIDFRYVGRYGQILLPVSDYVTLLSSDCQSLPANQIHRDISMHGWCMIISGSDKQTSAVLQLYFRLRFRPHRRNGHAILHRLAKFHPNGNIQGGFMMLYRFSSWRPLRCNFTSGFGLGTSVSSECQSLSGTEFHRNISIRGYFRFEETNVHIGIVLPVTISTISP